MEKAFLGVKLNTLNKLDTLEKIKKYIQSPFGFFQITSINPENLIIARENKEFKKATETSQIQIIDGVGIVIASYILGLKVEDRFTGVELMEELIGMAGELRLRVLLIGGRPNLADSLAKCYQLSHVKAKFIGLEGIKNIKNPLKSEEESIFSIVTSFKPHILLASFGSPQPEL